MTSSINRRQFIFQSAAVGSALAASPLLRSLGAAEAVPELINIAVMGLGRGSDLVAGFAQLPGCQITRLCEVDESRLAKAQAAIAKLQKIPPAAVKDVRRVLDDGSVHALIVAAPDHWHAPATILACAAGKHVYVEKPASHNAREGELMVAAARKYNRVVQLGTQRRSGSRMIEAMERIRAGDLGKVLFSRGWYNNTRKSIGRGKQTAVPGTLDYTLWQGPAPERPYQDNITPYNWHWFWHWGTGELGNNGIHSLGLCRWGLGVDYPTRVTSSGGRYYFKDDQETPDTHFVTFDFGDKVIAWEGQSCHPRGFENSGFGAAFYGDKATLVTDGNSYTLFDPAGKQMAKAAGSGNDTPHLQNFLDCIRNGKRPNADIENGHKSTLLCHLGNIAHRTGRAINVDSKTGQIQNDAEAQKLWSRDYRPGWEPKV